MRSRRSSQGGVRASEKRRGPGDALMHPRKFNKKYGVRLPLFLSRFPVKVNPPNKKSVSLRHVGVWRRILKEPCPRFWECHSNGPGRVIKLGWFGSCETRPPSPPVPPTVGQAWLTSTQITKSLLFVQTFYPENSHSCWSQKNSNWRDQVLNHWIMLSTNTGRRLWPTVLCFLLFLFFFF